MSLIFSLLFLGLILAGIYLLAKKAGRLRFKKMSYWIIAGYTGVVLISSAAVPFFLGEAPHIKAKSEEGLDFDRLYNLLGEGEIEELEDRYILEHTSFKQFDEPKLVLSSNDPNIWAPIFVERKKEEDGLLEAYIVGQSFAVGEYEFPLDINPIELKLDGDRLAIKITRQELNISAARDSFPVRQLTGDSLMDYSFGPEFDQMIYLRVPAGIEVETEDESIYFDYTEE